MSEDLRATCLAAADLVRGLLARGVSPDSVAAGLVTMGITLVYQHLGECFAELVESEAQRLVHHAEASESR